MLTVNEWTTLLLVAFSAVAAMITAGWVSAWWLSRKFSGLTKQIDDQIEKLEGNLIKKMEYHEEHDDSRFTQVRNDIWELRLENAAKEGKVAIATRHKSNTDN